MTVAKTTLQLRAVDSPMYLKSQAQEEIGVTIKPADVSVTSVLHRKLELKNGGHSEFPTACAVLSLCRNLAVITLCWSERAGEYIDFFCTVKSWQGPIVNREPEKCAALEFHDIDQLPATTIDYVRYVELSCSSNACIELLS